MKHWKNWLPPILTSLVVLALALLPQRLSALRDKTLTGAIHTEELPSDSNFPAKPPELARRLQLLAQYVDFPDTLTIIGQDPSDSVLAENTERAQEELTALTEAKVLPENSDFDSIELFASKVYLRDQSDLSSAGFVNLSGYDQSPREYPSLVLDDETGLLVKLEIIWTRKDSLDPAAMGEAFLDRLGLEYQLTGCSNSSAACFRLLKVPVLYWVTADRYTLRIEPQLDWESIISTGSLPGSQAIATDSDITGQQRTIGFSDGKRSLADTPPQVNRRQAQKTEMMPF